MNEQSAVHRAGLPQHNEGDDGGGDDSNASAQQQSTTNAAGTSPRGIAVPTSALVVSTS